MVIVLSKILYYTNSNLEISLIVLYTEIVETHKYCHEFHTRVATLPLQTETILKVESFSLSHPTYTYLLSPIKNSCQTKCNFSYFFHISSCTIHSMTNNNNKYGKFQFPVDNNSFVVYEWAS